MREINVAIVGCGYVANDHLKAWKKLDSVRVVAVSDLNETLAKNTASQWRIPHYYLTLSKLIEVERIDVVDLCTPPQTHTKLAVDAMKAGCNTLIEKPMAMTLRDAEEILLCRKTTGMKAGVIHNWLFEPCVLEANSLVEKGRLGDMLSMEIEALSPPYDSMAANERHWCHSLPGGRFSEMLAHPIYLARRFLGKNTVLADVKVSKQGNYPWMRSDELCAIFQAGNRLGRVYVSFNAPRDAIFLNLYGREATLRLDIINATVSILPRRKTSRFSKGYDSIRQAAQLTKSTIKNSVMVASGRWLSGHEKCIKLFVESLLKSDDKYPVTIEEACEVTKILERACTMIEQEESQR